MILRTASTEFNESQDFCLTCPECVKEQIESRKSRLDDKFRYIIILSLDKSIIYWTSIFIPIFRLRNSLEEERDCGYSTESEPLAEKCETFVWHLVTE